MIIATVRNKLNNLICLLIDTCQNKCLMRDWFLLCWNHKLLLEHEISSEKFREREREREGGRERERERESEWKILARKRWGWIGKILVNKAESLEFFLCNAANYLRIGWSQCRLLFGEFRIKIVCVFLGLLKQAFLPNINKLRELNALGYRICAFWNLTILGLNGGLTFRASKASQSHIFEERMETDGSFTALWRHAT